MERTDIKRLKAWQHDPLRKPLLLLGARQIGKSWLLQEFGRTCFEHMVVVEFETNARAREIFEQDYDIPRILNALQLEARTPIIPGKTLVVLDEIQACPAALTALKYLCEKAPEVHVAAAGSLLGLEIHYGTGFPVGKVNMMNMYPLSFKEFLAAMEYGQLVEPLEARDWRMVNLFHDKYVELLRYYYYIGGMPGVVQTYLTTHDFKRVRDAQKDLLAGYRMDFSKHTTNTDASAIEKIWNAIPEQLSKENKKFVFSEAHPSLRARTAAAPMLWLLRSGLIHHNCRVKAPRIPLTAYQDGAFKVFLNDVGLLSALCNLDTRVLLEGSRLFGEYKGALTEQYVLQQLLTTGEDANAFYWAREKNEIDFLLTMPGGIVPLESKAELNLNSKSLHAYCQRFGCGLAVRTSMHTYQRNTVARNNATPYELVELPLYAVSEVYRECESVSETK